MEAQKFNRLIRKIQHDRKALEIIYNEYLLPLKGRIKFRYNNIVDCEDVAHEVFLKLTTTAVKKYIAYPASWLYRIADNCAIDFLRKNPATAQYIENLNGQFEFDIERSLAKDEIKRAMVYLDKTTQQILYMQYWEKYELKEIAMELKISYSNVRAMAARGRKKLKKILQQNGELNRL